MARKKRRRPNAGPPVVRTARREAPAASTSVSRPTRARAGRDGRPVPMSFRGIAMRAIVAAVIFFVYVMLVGKAGPGEALPFAAFAFVLMLPLGFIMDRTVLRIRLRRWERAQGAGPGNGR